MGTLSCRRRQNLYPPRLHRVYPAAWAGLLSFRDAQNGKSYEKRRATLRKSGVNPLLYAGRSALVSISMNIPFMIRKPKMTFTA